MPSTFKDKAGTIHILDLTIGCIRRVRNAINLDLLNLHQGDPPAAAKLGGDESLVCETLWHLLKPQILAADPQATEEQFYALLDGPAIGRAVSAFWEALRNFCQSLNRADQVNVIEAQGKAFQAQVTAIAANVAAIDVTKIGAAGAAPPAAAPEPAATAAGTPPQTQNSAATPGSSSTDSPESAASAPTATPSAS